MAFSIRLTDQEKKIADGYAKFNSMSLSEAFKQALFEKIEDEYDKVVFEEALNDYEKSNKKSRPIADFWDELGI